MLAELLRSAKCCIAYCGAGLSTSSGIADYASKSKRAKALVKGGDEALAPPSPAHLVLGALCRHGYIKLFVQQNHDGLTQKAGIPQESMNEIHGAWFDPSNTVVPMDGRLRSDLFAEMRIAATSTDLCLCLGTSLSGMNSDICAIEPARNPHATGTVIINLQKTCMDSDSCLRIWAPLDDVFKKLAGILNLVDLTPVLPSHPGDVFDIPYDVSGNRSENVRTTWDLRPGVKVRIAPRCASNYGVIGTIIGKNVDGHYVLDFGTCTCLEDMDLMGSWWIDSALRGAVPTIPLVNVDQQTCAIQDDDDDDDSDYDDDSDSDCVQDDKRREVQLDGVLVVKVVRNGHHYSLSLDGDVQHVRAVFFQYKNGHTFCRTTPFKCSFTLIDNDVVLIKVTVELYDKKSQSLVIDIESDSADVTEWMMNIDD